MHNGLVRKKGRESVPLLLSPRNLPLLFSFQSLQRTLPVMTCAGRFCRKGCVFRQVKEGWHPKSWSILQGREIFHQSIFKWKDGHCIKTRLSAQPLIWKWLFLLMQIKLIFTGKVVHFVSFWTWGFLELEVAYWNISNRCTFIWLYYFNFMIKRYITLIRRLV